MSQHDLNQYASTTHLRTRILGIVASDECWLQSCFLQDPPCETHANQKKTSLNGHANPMRTSFFYEMLRFKHMEAPQWPTGQIMKYTHAKPMRYLCETHAKIFGKVGEEGGPTPCIWNSLLDALFSQKLPQRETPNSGLFFQSATNGLSTLLWRFLMLLGTPGHSKRVWAPLDTSGSSWTPRAPQTPSRPRLWTILATI